MRHSWLQTSAGINFVAIGLVGISFSLILFTLQDFWILFRGEPYVLHGPRGIVYLLIAAVAAVFSAITVFIWRPGFHRTVIALFSVSMASHILEQFVPLPMQQFRLAAASRLIVATALILLLLRYRSTTAPGNS